MFNFNQWIETFQAHYRQHGTAYNDAADMVSLDDPSNRVEIVRESITPWKVIGIHHLTPEENQWNHNVYIELLCKQNEREAFKAIHWTWQGRRSNEAAPDVFAGQKPLNELVNIPINLGMIVSVWPHLGEIVTGLSSHHPDDGDGNRKGYHSFFVCFQEMDLDDPGPGPGPGPGPDPDPDPEPEPPSVIVGSIQVTVNQAWVAGLQPNQDGNVTFVVDVKADVG